MFEDDPLRDRTQVSQAEHCRPLFPPVEQDSDRDDVFAPRVSVLPQKMSIVPLRNMPPIGKDIEAVFPQHFHRSPP